VHQVEGLVDAFQWHLVGDEGIEVDFAALSPEVRENVRRYFVELSSLFTGGSLGTE